MYDVFISHASEDKPEVVRPLYDLLTSRGVKVWLDEQELTLGDSLRRNIDAGLSTSRFGVVVLSHAFFAKEWPQKELDSLVAREDGRDKVILPVWHNLTAKDVRAYSLLLADKVGATTSRGTDFVAEQIMRALDVERKREAMNVPTAVRVEEASASIQSAAEPAPEELPGGFTPIQSLIVDALDRVQDIADNYMGEITGISTGIADLDSLTLGLHKGEVTLVGARPLVGKTSFALNIVHHVVAVERLPVAFVSWRRTQSQFTDRLISVGGDIHTRHIERGALTDDEWGKLAETVDKYSKADLFFIERTESGLDEVVLKIKQLAAQFRGLLGLVVVDGNQAIRGEDVDGQGAGTAFKQLQQLAGDVDCPVIVTTSLNRTADARADQFPQIIDIPYLEKIERYVDNIILMKLHRSFYEVNIAHLIVARHRRAPSATVDVAFKQGTGQMLGLAPAQYDER